MFSNFTAVRCVTESNNHNCSTRLISGVQSKIIEYFSKRTEARIFSYTAQLRRHHFILYFFPQVMYLSFFVANSSKMFIHHRIKQTWIFHKFQKNFSVPRRVKFCIPRTRIKVNSLSGTCFQYFTSGHAKYKFTSSMHSFFFNPNSNSSHVSKLFTWDHCFFHDLLISLIYFSSHLNPYLIKLIPLLPY